MPTVTCPALIIASPSSGQGKTTFTAALARAHKQRGLRVAVFKMGPDYLDPMIHEVACGQTVYNLDLWMMGEAHCRALLFDAASHNDLILIESLMGLHDNQPSCAEFAQLFNIPVLLLMNVAKYAQTAAAIVHGLHHYPGGAAGNAAQPFTLYGVVGNRVGSENHHRIIEETLADKYLGSVKRDDNLQLPHRHLGLVQAQELDNLEHTLNHAAEQLSNAVFASARLLQLPPAVEFIQPQLPQPELSQPASSQRQNTQEKYISTNKYFENKIIAIAKDAAFSFIYPANIDYLKCNGAAIKYFSPLKNEPVPLADMLWLPGGYPELHLPSLAQNSKTKQSIEEFCTANKPVLAECGGFIYLLDSITDKHGNKEKMCGVMPGDATLKKRFQGLGLQSRINQGAEYRGHSFHHSLVSTPLQPESYSIRQNNEQAEAVYRYKNITASYLHHYFYSCEDFFW